MHNTVKRIISEISFVSLVCLKLEINFWMFKNIFKIGLETHTTVGVYCLIWVSSFFKKTSQPDEVTRKAFIFVFEERWSLGLTKLPHSRVTSSAPENKKMGPRGWLRPKKTLSTFRPLFKATFYQGKIYVW
jgi:hypothetical protein